MWCAGQLWETIGGFRKEYDGAQDYDFIFRCCESAKEIYHVPEILYHWRTHQASTADNPASKMYAFEAGKRAIEGNLERCHLKAEVSHTKDLGFTVLNTRWKVHRLSRLLFQIRMKESP